MSASFGFWSQLFNRPWPKSLYDNCRSLFNIKPICWSGKKTNTVRKSNVENRLAAGRPAIETLTRHVQPNPHFARVEGFVVGFSAQRHTRHQRVRKVLREVKRTPSVAHFHRVYCRLRGLVIILLGGWVFFFFFNEFAIRSL